MLYEIYTEYGRLLFAVLLTVVLGAAAYYGIRKSFALLYARGLMPKRLHVMALNVLRWLLIVLVTLMVLQELGVAVSSVWATISTVLVAVAVGFVAVWSVLSNLLCSIILSIVEPFRIGDEIEIIEPTGGTGLRGRVRELNLLYTSIDETSDLGPSGTSVQIPNNVFFQKTIRKHSSQAIDSRPLHVREG
jgi:small-conductance mechanosensitive channel